MLTVFFLILLSGILLSLPAIQTKLAKYASQEINKEFGTQISIEKATVSIFGGVKLKQVLIKDHKKDTLFYINNLKTTIVDYRKLLDGDLTFGNVTLGGLKFHLVNYKKESSSNLDQFIALFDDEKPNKTTKEFLLTTNNLTISNGHFKVVDYNLDSSVLLDAKKLDASASNLKIYGSDVIMKINKMSFNEQRGLKVTSLAANFTYTKRNILLDKLYLQTPNSKLNADVGLFYKREDFSDFNNKVVFDIKVDKASVSSNDLNLFYGEFGTNQQFKFKTILKGTLNNFTTKKLNLVDNNNSQIVGDFEFKNLFTKNKNTFYMKGDFEKITSTYQNLNAILPRVLGENLPSTFKKFGTFTIKGVTEVTLQTINANILLETALGKTKANLKMTNLNNIDNATYIGQIKLDNFQLGKLLNRTDIGVVNIDLDVDGKGFTQKLLATKLKGNINSVYYNQYNYKNITVDGTMINSIFKGDVVANDPNLQMSFDGAFDLSKKINKYDFHVNVEYANLYNLRWYTPDSIAVFRGDVTMNLEGNSIENLYGNILINQTSFENSRDTYLFDDFVVNSTFDENRVRTISLNSPDIIDGKMVGKYQFNQLQKLFENSLGSLYANYTPNKLNKGQFIKFDFNVYSKLIEIFYPDISLGQNTKMYGGMNSDNGEFKLNIKSPTITAFNTIFDNINIEIDNKNPLYNTYIALDSIKTKNYKISDFSLINVTAKDTLFFRTEFKGGKKAQDFYNLNLYHTINKENNSVVGIKKSEINFKDYLWFINENESETDNKIIFNKKLTDFSIEKIAISHKNELLELRGVLRDSTYKDLQLSFKDINLDKITPAVETLKFGGKVNGMIDFKQNKSIYEPSSSVSIDSLSINDFALGKLNLQVRGDDSFKTFKVNSSLVNNGLKAFTADGDITVENKNTYLNLNLELDNLNLEPFSPMGGDVINKIRGLASGTAKIDGEANDPNISGRLYLNQAGIAVPYLNLDYNLKENAVVDITENQFSFRKIELTDTKFGTQGILDGVIRHNKFSDWFLDLDISSDRLLALNTKDSENALYYGTAFIDGQATIKGPTNGLVINVNAKTERGTSLKIPINDSETTSERDFIKFLTAREKFIKLNPWLVDKNKNKKNKGNGLELNFQLGISKGAEVEIIIDKNTGHGIKAKAFDGDILMEINTLGKFKMYGDFIVDSGEYNFKYGGIIDKKFSVKPSSSISWSGDPLDATLNIEALYKTLANPAVLLENPSFNKKIPTEVTIKITNKLANPIPEFFIDFPTLGSNLKSELDYKLNDEDTRLTQAYSLLSSGSFLSDRGVGENIITGNLLEKASSLFDDILSGEDDKFKVGLNIVQGDRSNPQLETDGRVGLSLSTQINNKISLNGKVGVPIGGLNESVIVGDVEIQMRLNEDGSLNARVFNRENDITYIGEGIGFTQGIGLSYEVDFNTFRELISKIITKNKNKDNKDSQDQIPDSDLTPEFIRFAEERQKKKDEKPKPLNETVPEIN